MPVAKLQNANCVLRSNCAERVNSRRVLTNKWADYSTPHYGTGTARVQLSIGTGTGTVLPVQLYSYMYSYEYYYRTVARSLSTKYLVPVLYWYQVLVQYEYCTAYMKEVGKFNTSGDREC